MNHVQFAPGMSLTECLSHYGTGAQCERALIAQRWPDGFFCPRCGAADHCILGHGARILYPRCGCRYQALLTAGTLMDSNRLRLPTWFLATYLLSQAQAVLSALALVRQLGSPYRTVRLIRHKFMATLAQRGSQKPLCGHVQLVDAHLGDERLGAGGHGSPNKASFFAAVSSTADVRLVRAKISAISGFSNNASADRARAWT